MALRRVILTRSKLKFQELEDTILNKLKVTFEDLKGGNDFKRCMRNN
jgi:hypothetical protein